MIGIIKKKISITSLMFNAGFYSSYSMNTNENQFRPEQLSINSVDEISNERQEDNIKLYETERTIVKKDVLLKKNC